MIDLTPRIPEGPTLRLEPLTPGHLECVHGYGTAVYVEPVDADPAAEQGRAGPGARGRADFAAGQDAEGGGGDDTLDPGQQGVRSMSPSVRLDA